MSQELKLPQGTLYFPDVTPLPLALIVAGGRKPGQNWLGQVGESIKEIYAADKGLAYAKAAGLNPQIVIGDGDSCEPEVWQEAKAQGIVHEFPVKKDATDLQLLLKDLPESRFCVFTGIWGGRYDHLYSAVHSLSTWCQGKQVPLVIADERELLVMLPEAQHLTFTPPPEEKPLAISVLPLSNEGIVSLEGVLWPLKHAVMKASEPYAVSNELTAEKMSFICEKGLMGLYIAG